jgi:D-alanyl-lipoteichoic acid acyltransferase DltB (MBOAT superfamily)
MMLYSLQLYADFSGGMDVVLGVSQVLGLKLSENFNVPFLAETFQEFWRRWHITLGAFLRSYVYIPLGGNRKGQLRKSVNLLITFLVSGIWHGLEYLLWGLINGIFVALGDKFKTKWKHFNRFLTFFLVSLLWAFFVWPNTATALSMVGSVVTTFNYASFFETILDLGLTVGDWIVLAVAALGLWIYDVRGRAIPAALERRSWATRTAVICALGLLVLVFGMYGLGFDQQAFIYSKF